MNTREIIPRISHILVSLLIIQVTITAGACARPAIEGVQIYPGDHIWNVPVDNLPLDPQSAYYIMNIGSDAYLHADFGSGLWNGYPIGIPYNIVSGSNPKKTITFVYSSESDLGPYPIPDNPLIEGGSDRHVLILDRDNGILYEIYAAEKQPDGSWHAGSGAVFNLSEYALRPAGWTSADAAGLPILPGLVRYEEVNAGEISHAIRVTAPFTKHAYVWPARHYASDITDPGNPPMGQRFRLKASFDSSGYSPQARVILDALKHYGMILADNGAPWYISGVPDERWDNDVLHTLHSLKGSDFEAIDSSSLMIDPDSGKARISARSVNYIGVFRDGLWVLDKDGDFEWDGLPTDVVAWLGQSGDTVAIDDWDGAGRDNMGIFRDGLWVLDHNENFQWDGPPDDTVAWLGQTGDTVAIGIW